MKQIKHLTLSALLLFAGMSQAQTYVGGDLSMLPKYEEQGATYLDQDGGRIADLLGFVKQQKWNTIRVRLFVDPSSDKDKAVCQDLDYVAQLGKRIKDAGLNFLLDFHYSDTWADPGKQYAPYSWTVYSWRPEETFYKYTKECLETLVAAGATPDLIQTGNEISFGMHWEYLGPDGNVTDYGQFSGRLEANKAWTDYLDTNWENLANYLKSASKACREVCPDAKIIIHTEQCANNPTLDVAFFKHVEKYGIDYDVIGVSYYPYFKGELSKLDNGLSKLEASFPNKQIQVVETGYPSKWEVQGTTYNYTKTYPYSHEGQRKYTADLIAMLKKHKQVNGLSWWYAEANAKGCNGNLSEGWYNASLFDNETGRALPALYELGSFNDTSAGISAPVVSRQNDGTRYSLDGKRLDSAPSAKGVYINDNRKVVVR